MDVSSAFLSQLLCEDLMLLFIHRGDGFLQLLRVLALVTALAPTSGAAAALGSAGSYRAPLILNTTAPTVSSKILCETKRKLNANVGC